MDEQSWSPIGELRGFPSMGQRRSLADFYGRVTSPGLDRGGEGFRLVGLASLADGNAAGLPSLHG
jgi:hypothetical protein